MGLSHSDVRSALMAPFYRGYEPSFSLDLDDIQGIQALYGKKTQKWDQPDYPGNDDNAGSDGGGDEEGNESKNSGNGEDPVLCKNPKIDTIFNTADGSTYVFKVCVRFGRRKRHIVIK